MSSTVHVVVAAHGSRADAANTAHRRVAEALAEAVGATVRPAFLELAEPSIPAAIDGAVADGADEVVVLPYFLHPGRHTGEDLPRIVADATRRHPDVEVRLLPLFGADSALVGVLVDQVRTAVPGA